MSKKPTKKLPQGWDWVRLGDVLTESLLPGTDGLRAKKLTVKLYGRGIQEKIERVPGSEKTRYYSRRAGQFIYSKLDFLNGAFAIIPFDLDGYESTIDLPAFDIDPSINSQYLLNYVARPEFYAGGLISADGTRKARRVQPDEFLSIFIPLPPLPVQHWIADALASVDGWLEASERNSEWLEIARRKIISDIFPPGTIELADLIESVQSGVSAEGANIPASANESGVVKVSAVAQGFFNPSENKVVVGKEVSRLRTPVKAGDILVSRSNTLDLVGEVGMPSEDYPNLFLPDKLWALRVKSSLDIDQKWLMYYLVSVKNSGIIANLASGSSGSMKNISQKHYLKILVPKIDIELQREVSSALTVLDEYIIAQNEYLVAGKRFRQSFFHQILSGNLQPKVGWEAVLRQSAQAGAP